MLGLAKTVAREQFRVVAAVLKTARQVFSGRDKPSLFSRCVFCSIVFGGSDFGIGIALVRKPGQQSVDRLFGAARLAAGIARNGCDEVAIGATVGMRRAIEQRGCRVFQRFSAFGRQQDARWLRGQPDHIALGGIQDFTTVLLNPVNLLLRRHGGQSVNQFLGRSMQHGEVRSI